MGSTHVAASPSRQSLAGLAALNVFLADVRDGLGPYLAIYLSLKHWEPSRIGMAMSAMGIATVIAQTPAGAFVDRTRHKRGVITVAAILVAIGAVAMIARPTFPVILAAQSVIGAAGAIFPPAIAAISLGLVGHRMFAHQTGRNEAFNHAGNVAAALLAGFIGDYIAYEGIFILVAMMSIGSIASVMFIRHDEIDHELARGCDPSGAKEPVGWLTLFSDRRILVFTAAIVLFHFANAAMLPLVGQKLTLHHKDAAAMAMSACIVVAQVVMVPVALLSSKLAETWGRRAVFLAGFAVLPVRGLLYTRTENPYALVAIQVLDGIGAGIFGVVGVLVVADLTRGTGRFNLLQGALATATGLGAALSNSVAGFVVEKGGIDRGFLFLAATALVSLVFFAVLMPETAFGVRERSGRFPEAAIVEVGRDGGFNG